MKMLKLISLTKDLNYRNNCKAVRRSFRNSVEETFIYKDIINFCIWRSVELWKRILNIE